MAEIYCDLIRKQLRTVDDVPLRWKEQVKELLDTDAK
ncbi:MULTISPECIES: CD1375 family protein [unclassified Paenibacillus]|nr:CD1375 family protein [Paenibacillus macerans]